MWRIALPRRMLVLRVFLLVNVWLSLYAAYRPSGYARRASPWDSSWLVVFDGCPIEGFNPHDRRLFAALVALAVVGTVAAVLGRDWTAGTALTAHAALAAYAIGLQGPEWQAFVLLNGEPGSTCTESWKSTEFVLRQTYWYASQQTNWFYAASLYALVIVAGTAVSGPRAGQWHRSWRGRRVPLAVLWAPLAAASCALPLVPHLSAEAALDRAPQREILLYTTLLALLVLGLSALLPHARLRALGVTALSLALAVAFTQAAFMASFIAEQTPVVAFEEAGDVRVGPRSSLTDYQEAALDRVRDFYVESALVALALLAAAVVARLLLGGTLFTTTHSAEAPVRPRSEGTGWPEQSSTTFTSAAAGISSQRAADTTRRSLPRAQPDQDGHGDVARSAAGGVLDDEALDRRLSRGVRRHLDQELGRLPRLLLVRLETGLAHLRASVLPRLPQRVGSLFEQRHGRPGAGRPAAQPEARDLDLPADEPGAHPGHEDGT